MTHVVIRDIEKFPGLQPVSIILLYLGSHKIIRINKNLELRVLNYIDDGKPRVLPSPTTLDGCQFN